jgi:hypothetical protein
MNARWFVLAYVSLLLLLAACIPAQPGNSGTPADPTPGDKGDVSVDEGGQVIEIPENLAWDLSPDAVVISAETIGGFVPVLYSTNALADARIWGDGRIIWVVSEDDGSRSVYEGRLSQEQLLAIVNQFDEAEFFDMQDRYANNLVADAPERCLRIQLLERTKQVCEYVEGAPVEFHELFGLVESGAGVEGDLYIPAQGFVKTYVLGQAGEQLSQADVLLEADSPFAMADYVQGAWAEGPVLAAAWEQVNLRPFGSVIQQGETYYQVSVQVPGLSLAPPPDSE